MKTLHYYIFVIFILSLSCTDEAVIQTPGNPIPEPQEWLVPEDLVFDGGPGKDGIPSIDKPKFTSAAQVDFLKDQDLVLGIQIGDEIKVYPHPILDWHEIVNDRIGEESIALTYCPLTGTGIGWDRIINGDETTFGVSGLLYNTNLMPYDRATNSTWSQQRLDCVNGENIGLKATLHSFIETTWKTWKQAYPSSLVLNTDTGFDRNYTRYPYGDYRTNHNNIIFPVTNEDNRLDAKERVLGVRINEVFKAYPFNPDKSNIEKINDSLEGEKLIIVRSTTKNYIVAFNYPLDGSLLNALSEEKFPAILEDSNGTQYDLFGKALDKSGKNLERPEQFIGYWFSWAAFYPEIEIFE